MIGIDIDLNFPENSVESGQSFPISRYKKNNSLERDLQLHISTRSFLSQLEKILRRFSKAFRYLLEREKHAEKATIKLN